MSELNLIMRERSEEVIKLSEGISDTIERAKR